MIRMPGATIMTMREKDTAAADMDTAATTIAVDTAETDKVRGKLF